MGIKEELKDLRAISKIIDSKERQLSQLKRYYTTVKAFDYSREKISGGKRQDFTDTVNKLVDLENEITKDIDALADKKQEMDKFIKDVLTGNEYVVIQMRYFEDSDWLEIAIKLNYTIDNIYKIHGKALFKLNKVYSKLQ
ncbi:DUF1492 domain-containing protein [Peptoanaerobacter stomatis]|uniref:DUF1492 domain-containing protein n=1 Tax=Peptoanaerobacter stomatis TaxID=796937 RepID=UPI003F9F55BE